MIDIGNVKNINAGIANKFEKIPANCIFLKNIKHIGVDAKKHNSELCHVFLIPLNTDLSFWNFLKKYINAALLLNEYQKPGLLTIFGFIVIIDKNINPRQFNEFGMRWKLTNIWYMQITERALIADIGKLHK
jgi:hypothetical protein